MGGGPQPYVRLRILSFWDVTVCHWVGYGRLEAPFRFRSEVLSVHVSATVPFRASGRAGTATQCHYLNTTAVLTCDMALTVVHLTMTICTRYPAVQSIRPAVRICHMRKLLDGFR